MGGIYLDPEALIGTPANNQNPEYNLLLSTNCNIISLSFLHFSS